MGSFIRKSWVGFSLLAFCLLVACSHVWVVERDADGGVIGYEGYTSEEDAEKDFKKLVQCPYGYTLLSDELKSRVYLTTAYVADPYWGTSYWGSGYGYMGAYGYGLYGMGSPYVPMPQTRVSQWHELKYHCNAKPTAENKHRLLASSPE